MYQVFTEIYRGIKRAHKTATDCIADRTGIENLKEGQSDKNHNKIQWWRWKGRSAESPWSRDIGSSIGRALPWALPWITGNQSQQQNKMPGAGKWRHRAVLYWVYDLCGVFFLSPRLAKKNNRRSTSYSTVSFSLIGLADVRRDEKLNLCVKVLVRIVFCNRLR
jgi:hypothetical protein